MVDRILVFSLANVFLLKLMPVHTTNIPLNYANSLSKILIANTRAKSII